MNNFTAIVNLCRDPEALELGGRTCQKLRLADNTFGKNAETRFFDAIVSGPDADVAARLKSADSIAVTGTLVKGSYKGKKGKNKGKTVETDSMPFAKILQVIKSPSFFEGGSDDSDEGDDSEPDLDGVQDAPDDDADAVDPLADLE